jgi:hypothetical protein
MKTGCTEFSQILETHSPTLKMTRHLFSHNLVRATMSCLSNSDLFWITLGNIYTAFLQVLNQVNRVYIMSHLNLMVISSVPCYDKISTKKLFSCKTLKHLCKPHHYRDKNIKSSSGLDYHLLILVVNEEFMNYRRLGLFSMTNMGKT